MKRLIRFASLFVLMFAAACAQADTQATATDSGVDGLSPAYTAGKCAIRLKLNGGTMSASAHTGSSFTSFGYYPPGTEEWSVALLCHAGESQETIDFTLHSKMVNGKWIWSDANEPFTPAQRFKTYQIHGKNWTGRWVEYDTIYGSPDINFRKLSFCLFQTHGPQVLCGGYNGHPNAVKRTRAFNKDTKRILNVIKTIVFVDQQAEKSSAPDMSGVAH